ncbi:MAG: NifB/NifX family molybdenum-iron cluster-binding protein [Acidaminococcaceae bacterium]|nr:NifB/NifX family molybdenum-iron cluster-binding protein [Acidaminococcaceae bacterium]MDD4721574.1 NifB/NifX family molybdenum-iron cluster-binding protein [Acidaminococcaceae bacterium]
MKIALPVDEGKNETGICISFGRAPYFMFYDTETKDSSFLLNSAAESQGGAGIKAAQLLADNKVDVLLTPRCGQNAAEVLQSSNIKIFKTIGASVRENIQDFSAGKLAKLSEIHAGFHNHGGR